MQPLGHCLLVACLWTGLHAMALAQPAPSPETERAPPSPTEFSEDARRAYAQGLKEAREAIAQKRYDQAIERLDALNRSRPREPQARFLKSVAQSDQGHTDDALATLRELAADFPELPEIRNNLAVLYVRKGEYELARRELETAIATAPDYAIAYENLGDVYASLAARQYSRASELEKTNKAAAGKLKVVRDMLASTPK